MAQCTPVLPQLDPAIIRRQLGISPKFTLPESLIIEAGNMVMEKSIPRGSWEIYPFDGETDTVLALPALSVGMLPGIALLTGSQQVALVSVTLGYLISDSATSKLQIGDYTEGLLLNAAAKCALDLCSNQVISTISQQANQRGFSIGNHIVLPANLSFFSTKDFLLLSGGQGLGIAPDANNYLQPEYSLLVMVGLHPYQFRIDLPATSHDFSSETTDLKCQARQKDAKRL